MQVSRRIARFPIIKNLKAIKGVSHIILFGSVARGESNGNSDLDLIVVLKDNRTKRQVERIINPYRGNLIERSTGMFKSFVCSEKDFIEQRFSSIFSTNPLMTYLLAPTSIVFKGIARDAKILYGNDLISKWDTRIKSLDILKAILCNFLLAVGAIPVFIIDRRACLKFSAEAEKWAYINSSLLKDRRISIKDYQKRRPLFAKVRNEKYLSIFDQIIYVVSGPLRVIELYVIR